MRIRNAQNMAEPCHFFPAENAGNMTEITAFAVFHLTFFLIFVVLYLSDSHHQVGPFSTLLVLSRSKADIFVRGMSTLLSG